jgi:hypothetical protein
MATTIETRENNIATASTPTAELRWALQNAEGARPRMWVLQQKVIVERYATNNEGHILNLRDTKEEWRAIPLAMPPDAILEFSKAHAGFVPHELHMLGDMK